MLLVHNENINKFSPFYKKFLLFLLCFVTSWDILLNFKSPKLHILITLLIRSFTSYGRYGCLRRTLLVRKTYSTMDILDGERSPEETVGIPLVEQKWVGSE